MIAISYRDLDLLISDQLKLIKANCVYVISFQLRVIKNKYAGLN